MGSSASKKEKVHPVDERDASTPVAGAVANHKGKPSDAKRTSSNARSSKTKPGRQLTAEEQAERDAVEKEFEEFCFQVFEKADTDNNGTLDANEIKSVLFSKTLGLGLTDEQADEIVEKFNEDNDDVIDYREFSTMLRYLLQRVQEHVMYAENDWVLIRNEGEKVLYMNKRTGECQHTKPLTFREDKVEYVEFEERELPTGETVMVRPNGRGGFEYIDFASGKWVDIDDAQTKHEDHSFSYMNQDTWFQTMERSTAVYLNNDGEERSVPMTWLAERPETQDHLEQVGTTLGYKLDTKKDRAMAMFALCYTGFDLVQTIEFLQCNGFVGDGNPIPDKAVAPIITDNERETELEEQLKVFKSQKAALEREVDQLSDKLKESERRNQILEEKAERANELLSQLRQSPTKSRVASPEVGEDGAILAEGSIFKETLKQLYQEVNVLKEDLKSNKSDMSELKSFVVPTLKATIATSKKINAAAASDNESLMIKYKKEMALRKKYFNTMQELKGNIRVFVRVRKDNSLQGKPAVTAHSSNEVMFKDLNEKKPPHIMDFNRVYGSDTEQAEVFTDTKDTIMSVIDGYNVCILAYGQTGSGKTWTMMGPEDNPGVNRRAIAELLTQLAAHKDDLDFKLAASQVEVYNEGVYDLLSNADRADTKLQTRQIKNVCELPGLTWRDVSSADDVAGVMADGDKNRSVAATSMNSSSSRSHLIFQMKVETTNKISGSKTTGLLMLVDLAGSERVEKSEVTGAGLVEAAAINKSLSALGLVFQSLAKGEPHIPYRNSALTQVLSGSLGGNAKCCMFANLSPLENNLSESISTLQFASNVTKISLGPAKKTVSRHR